MFKQQIDGLEINKNKNKMASTIKKTWPEIPLTADDFPRWQSFEQWHDRADVRWPSSNTAVPVQNHCDRYQRFPGTRITTTTNGVYNWTWFDAIVNECIVKKQKLHFGIMDAWPDSPSGVLNAGGITFPEGGVGVYPIWLHNLMQAHATLKDWYVTPGTDVDGGGGYWIPNYNNPDYHAYVLARNQAIVTHVISKGWTKIIGCVDIRGNGSWGEWHHHPYSPNSDVLQFPSGRRPSIASLKTIIDAHKNGFPDYQLQIMLSTFDAEWLRNTYTQPEVTEYALISQNNVGKFGWRRDNVGATDGYMKDYVEFNYRGFGSIPAGSGPSQGFKVPILARPDVAPVTGEPPGWNPSDYFDLERQVKLHRMSSFGNGNYGVTPNTTISDRVRAAAKSTGSRIKMIDSEVTFASGTLTVKINWQNVGSCPLYKYDDPDIIIEVLNSVGAIVQTKTSTFNLVLFLPSTTPTLHTDNFAMSLPNGTYSARLYVKDANAYRDNYRLAVQGADASFRYPLGAFDVATTVPPNPGPVVSAGGDKQVQLPIDSVTLVGTVTDDDPVQQVWTQRLKPTGAPDAVINPTAGLVTNVSNLKAGTYTFRLTATDSESATNYDEVNVNVLPAIVPPDPPTTTPAKKVVHTELFGKVVFDDGSAVLSPIKVAGLTTTTPTTGSGSIPTT